MFVNIKNEHAVENVKNGKAMHISRPVKYPSVEQIRISQLRNRFPHILGNDDFVLNKISLLSWSTKLILKIFIYIRNQLVGIYQKALESKF